MMEIYPTNPSSRLRIVLLTVLLVWAPSLFAKKPNIIVVFTDDHGWADLGIHGVRDDIKTPHLDQMAREGVVFKSGYITAPQCIPSRAGIVSGSYQQSFGVDDNRFSPMPAEVLTVPERLQKAGYTTGMVGKWHLDPNVASEEWLAENTYKGRKMPRQNERSIPLKDLLPFKTGSQGFDEHFEGYIYDYWANYDLQGNSLKRSGERVRTEPRDRLDIQTDAAMAFIDRNHENPFYLYLSYFAPHVPLETTEKYLSRFSGEMPERRRVALAMISAVDEGVGRIREQLRQYGELDDTLIFFIGDNGAPLKFTMEDIPLTFKGGAWDGSMNTPLNGEKGMLAEGGIRVPFVMSWPARVAAGQVLDIPVSSLDVGATAVDLAGLPRDEALHGENIFELMDNPVRASERPLYWRFWGQSALRLGDWKYLRAGEHEFLFNMKEDAIEKNNLLTSHPEKANSLRALWADWNEELPRPFQGEGGTLNDQEQRFFSFYFGSDTGADLSVIRKKSEGPWVVRNATAKVGAKGLFLSDFERSKGKAFLTVNQLEIGLESMLRINFEASEPGSGSVQVRYRKEADFEGASVLNFKFKDGKNSLALPLPVPSGKTLEHLRLILPYADQAISIRSIDIFSDGSVKYDWKY